MKKTIRVGIAQINTTVGDMRGNTKKILAYISEGKRWGIDILSFPELTITGYPPEDLLFNKHFIKSNRECLNKVMDKTEGIVVIAGFVDGKDDIYNAAAVVSNREIAGIYRKILLPNYGVFDEERYFTSGYYYPIFYIGDIPFAVNICEDIWSADGPTRIQAEEGNAALIFNISSSPYHAGKMLKREKMLCERAKENMVYIVYNNLAGGQDELVFDGGSMILNRHGEVIVRGKQFEEDLIIEDIEVESPTHVSPQPSKPITNIKLTSVINTKKKPIKKQACRPASLRACRLTMVREVYSALRTGTRDYVEKNNFSNVVIGLSGGIDSALTAVIAADALSADRIIGVSMPSIYSSKGSVDDTQALASNLGMQLITLPINSIFNAYKEALFDLFKDTKDDITEENIQARIRGNLLMALSNKFGWLVLTTGNKSEAGVGYCTLYGDMAGGFAVIKDVPKTLVYKLALYRNSLSNIDIIPQSIIKKPPSAELRPDQKDEDSLPPYSILDTILQAYIEENKSVAEIELLGYNRNLIEDILCKVDRNEYKRRQAPPGIKITPRAFGKDRRFPITNKYINNIEKI